MPPPRSVLISSYRIRFELYSRIEEFLKCFLSPFGQQHLSQCSTLFHDPAIREPPRELGRHCAPPAHQAPQIG